MPDFTGTSIKGRQLVASMGMQSLDYLYVVLDDSVGNKPQRFGYVELGTVNLNGDFLHYNGWSLYWLGVSIFSPTPRSFTPADEAGWALAVWWLYPDLPFSYGWAPLP